MQRLSDLYYDIHRSYLKVAEVVNSEKRLFGRYYRVAFYGQVSPVVVFCLHRFPVFSHVLLILMYFREAKTGKHLAVNHGVESASWVILQGGFYSEERALSCICVNCCCGFSGVTENRPVHQL